MGVVGEPLAAPSSCSPRRVDGREADVGPNNRASGGNLAVYGRAGHRGACPLSGSPPFGGGENLPALRWDSPSPRATVPLSPFNGLPLVCIPERRGRVGPGNHGGFAASNPISSFPRPFTRYPRPARGSPIGVRSAQDGSTAPVVMVCPWPDRRRSPYFWIEK